MRCLKQATLILALLGAIVLAGCGNGDTTSQTTYSSPGCGNNSTTAQTCNEPYKPKTHLTHRALVSNYYAGALDVMDATQDRLTTFTFAVGSGPTYLQPSPDGLLTLVNNTESNSISSFNNIEEAVKATIQLGGYTQSFVTSTDDESGFAAVPNVSNGNPPIQQGGIVRFNPTDGSLNTDIPFPYVQYLALDTAEQHLLAFTQGAPTTTVCGATVSQDDIANWVDLTAIDPATGVPPYYSLCLSGNASTQPLSRPIAAFFSTNSSNSHPVAYILSCGYECGGTGSASVTEIDTTTITPQTPNATGSVATATVLNQWTVNGARIGLIDTTANMLYVAGSTMTSTAIDCPFAELGTPACATTPADGGNNGGNNVQDGYFTAINLTTGTVVSSTRIGNGVKRWIRDINGVYWVASLNCGVESCVSMVTPTSSSATAAVLANANGDATGISLMFNSGQVYTIEGGELYIYNQNGTQFIQQNYNTDIKGQGSDVLYID